MREGGEGRRRDTRSIARAARFPSRRFLPHLFFFFLFFFSSILYSANTIARRSKNVAREFSFSRSFRYKEIGGGDGERERKQPRDRAVYRFANSRQARDASNDDPRYEMRGNRCNKVKTRFFLRAWKKAGERRGGRDRGRERENRSRDKSRINVST